MPALAQPGSGEDAGLQVLPGGRLHQGKLSIFTCEGKGSRKKRAILVQKLGEEKNCQNPFPAI